MSRELWALLIEATLAGSAAIALVLMLRRPLRAGFGAGAAYAAWCLVPAALLAILLPAAVVPGAPMLTPATVIGAATLPGQAGVASWDPRPLLLSLWGLGLLGMAWRLGTQQRRFSASLGTLRLRPDGLMESDAVAGLPAVIGWRANIVLPRDFDQRYDAGQQQLVLCHEQVHQRRGDLPVNALVSLLRCLFWFNPLVHFAAGRFRHDQELACDGAVLRAFPGHRRAYGDALLKTQLADRPLPVGCHWFGSHPLKERIAMLKRPMPSKARWFSGALVVALLTVAGGWTAWAAQPARTSQIAPSEGELALMMKVKFDGQGEFVESLNLPAGQPHTFRYEQDGQAWAIVLSITPRDDGTLFADANITRDGVGQGQPKLVFKPGKNGAAIRIGQGEPGAGFKGIAIELQVGLPTSTEVTVQGQDLSARAAANRVAASAGLRVANPEALDDSKPISFRFNDVPARIALELIAQEAGLVLRIDGDQVYFEVREAAAAPRVVPAQVALRRPAADAALAWKTTLARWSVEPEPEAGC